MPSSDADKDVVRCPRRMWIFIPLSWLIFNLWWFCLMMYFWSLLLTLLLLLTLPSSLNGGDGEPLYDCPPSPKIALSHAENMGKYKCWWLSIASITKMPFHGHCESSRLFFSVVSRQHYWHSISVIQKFIFCVCLCHSKCTWQKICLHTIRTFEIDNFLIFLTVIFSNSNHLPWRGELGEHERLMRTKAALHSSISSPSSKYSRSSWV